MKSMQSLFNSLFIYSLLLTLANTAAGQSKFSVSAGVGLAESINIGSHFNAGNFQTGIRFGVIPSMGTSSKTITLDVAYHMLGNAKLSERRPWYTKASLHFYQEYEEKIAADKYVLASLKFGREFNITKKIGFHIDAGPVIPLSRNDAEKGWLEDFQNDFQESLFILPSASIGIFYKF